MSRPRRSRPAPAPEELTAGLPAIDPAGRPVRVVVLGREGCHLCEVAAAVVAEEAAAVGAGWVERQVTASPSLLQRYAEHVPVVFVDGTEHARLRVDRDRLRAALRPRRRGLRDFVQAFTKS